MNDKGAICDQSKSCCSALVTLKSTQDWMERRGSEEDVAQCEDNALQNVAVQGGVEGSLKIQTDLS